MRSPPPRCAAIIGSPCVLIAFIGRLNFTLLGYEDCTVCDLSTDDGRQTSVRTYAAKYQSARKFGWFHSCKHWLCLYVVRGIVYSQQVGNTWWWTWDQDGQQCWNALQLNAFLSLLQDAYLALFGKTLEHDIKVTGSWASEVLALPRLLFATNLLVGQHRYMSPCTTLVNIFYSSSLVMYVHIHTRCFGD